MSFFGNSNFLQALGWAVLNSLWQMAFLWVIFQVILTFGVHKSAVKSRLAAILLCTGFGWFLVTLLSHWLIDPLAAKRSLFSLATFETANTELNEGLQWMLPYASGIYLILLILPVIQFMRNYRFVQIIRNQGLSKCHVDLRMFVQRFSKRIGIHKPVHVYISDLVSSPVTIGFLKPIILMPMAAITHLSTKQVEAILLHELAHISRYDYFINLFVNLIRTILYFNPFVKSFARTIEKEREKNCDEIVMQFEYDPHGYASALLVLERNNYMPQSMAVAASGQKMDLLNRIEKILGIEKRKVPDLRKLGGVLAGFICIIGINALFFFSSPVIQNRSSSFNTFANPFYSLVSDGEEYKLNAPTEKKKNKTEEKTESIKSLVKITVDQSLKESIESISEYAATNPMASPAFINVGTFVEVLPELNKQEEEQVKGTVEATKKVLKEGQWKVVEKNIADVLTEMEKEAFKASYYNKLAMVDWKKLETNLRLSYDEINWENVNDKLNTAINNIKLDSISHVYNLALNNLSIAEKWMTENKCNSVPDTDVQLKEVKVEKERIRQQLKTINSVRLRKIIHL